MKHYWYNRQNRATGLSSRVSLRRLAVTFSLAALVLAWMSLPANASVPGDVKAGLPLAKVIDNGLKAGLGPEAVLEQALEAGADFCDLLRAAVGQKMDLNAIYRAFIKKYRSDPRMAEIYTPCTLIRCSVYAGKNLREVAKAMVSAGATVDEVRSCLAEIGCAEADAFAYTPPTQTPPTTSPTFPGGGGGGTGSPSQ